MPLARQSDRLRSGTLSAPTLGWDDEVGALRGVGPATRDRMARLGVHTIGDLLMHLPRGYQDRRRLLPLAQVAAGSDACVSATVMRTGSFLHRGRRMPTITIADDAGDRATLYAFGRPQLGRTLTTGQPVLVYGRFERRNGRVQAGSFELMSPEEMAAGTLIPVYPATTGLAQRLLRRLIDDALAAAAPSARYLLPGEVAAARRLPDKGEALRCVHGPPDPEGAERARRALAYEELFLLQLELARRSPAGRPRPAPRRRAGGLKAAVLERLPFTLTDAQRAALAEIEEDLHGPHTSARLLQGDVGCGKTLVALLAAAGVIDAGQQVAVVVPSEALCYQHAETASRLLEPLGVRLGLLSGSTDRTARTHLLPALAAGDIDMLLSTHAVLSEPVRFADLGLVVIDEQHKFGVAQRAAVAAKAPGGDLILMTATPIPRTLALTFFGDLTLSSIDRQPPGRPPLRTHLVREARRERVYAHVESELAAGRQAYFVCPSIGGAATVSDATAAEDSGDLFAGDADRGPVAAPAADADGSADSANALFARLRKRFGGFRVGLAHGGMPSAEQRATLSAFHAGAVDALVATTVVEVGLDVPNATCMVVEHAERFGLAALHQLRGRVGRGADPAYAFFVYDKDLTPQAAERLRALREHADGFALADLDLALRGPGELAGTRQTGLPPLRAARLADDLELMRQAQADARRHHRRGDTVSAVGERACG